MILKTLSLLISLLVVLLAVQTVRLHQLQHALDDATRAEAQALESPAPMQLAKVGDPDVEPFAESPVDGTASSKDEETVYRSHHGDDDKPKADTNGDAQKKADASEAAPGTANPEPKKTSPLEPAGKTATATAPKPTPTASSKPNTTASTKKSKAKKGPKLAAQIQASLTLARRLMEQGDYAGAESVLEGIADYAPPTASIYQAMANLYRFTGMAADEVQVYEDWIAQLPRDPTPHYLLASAYERQGLPYEASRELGAYEQMNNGNVSTYASMASLHQRLGDASNQRRVLESWVAQAPGSADARNALAQFYQQSGDYPAALAEFERTARIVPNNPTAHIGMAQAHQQLEQYTEAQAAFTTAMNLQPGAMSVRLQLADAYQRGGNTPMAIATYQGIIDERPNTAEARQAARIIANLQKPAPAKPKVDA